MLANLSIIKRKPKTGTSVSFAGRPLVRSKPAVPSIWSIWELSGVSSWFQFAQFFGEGTMK